MADEQDRVRRTLDEHWFYDDTDTCECGYWAHFDSPRRHHIEDMLVAALSAPPAERCGDCGHIHTPRGCTGDPTPSDLWAGVSVEGCDCDRDMSTPPAGGAS